VIKKIDDYNIYNLYYNYHISSKMDVANNDLITAHTQRDWDGVKRAVDAGADINVYPTRSGNKYTILYESIFLNHYDMAQYLISKGASVDLVSGPEEWTTLHLAISHKSIKMIKLLLDNGADIEIKNIYGKTPYDFALESNEKYIIECVESYGFPTKGVQPEMD